MSRLCQKVLGVVTFAFLIGVAITPANAITCVFVPPTQDNNPATCVDATPLTVYNTGNNAGVNPPTISLNGSLSLAKFNFDNIGGVLTPVGSDGAGPGDQVANFIIQILSSQSFNWTFIPEAGELSPTLLAIKAGNDWYFVDLLGALSGNFINTLLTAGISHIVFYDGASVIPLPPAALLFGTALVGLGILGRRRKRPSGQLAA